MEIRDVLYGSIRIEPHERAVLDSPFFQRLRSIKQLGFAEFSYPSATHNRFSHSLGAMEVATRAFDSIFGKRNQRPTSLVLPSAVFHKFRVLVRLAALLHDIGHGPLSHTSERAMPPAKDLKIPGIRSSSRQATHEDYTLKILLDSSLTPILEKIGELFEFSPLDLALLVAPEFPHETDSLKATIQGVNLDFKPILSQLISSEMDCDRMDYLRRDAFFAGVNYGNFEFDWLSHHLTSHLVKNSCYLALSQRALYAFEDFLLSRYHMFLMVYFHHKSIIYDQMLQKYFEECRNEYVIPADLESYLEKTDADLYRSLAKSKNPWAKRIVERRPYKLVFESHSGIPLDSKYQKIQQARFKELKHGLEKSKTPHIVTESTGELSKYFRKEKLPIFVFFESERENPVAIPLEKSTELFSRYGEKRFIHRIYTA